MGRNKMIAKSCPKCEMQVAVASKSCKCGHTFFASRRAADSLPAVEDTKRRTGRVRRSAVFYDASSSIFYRRSEEAIAMKRELGDDDYKGKEKETAGARARKRRALRRAARPRVSSPGRSRDPAPALLPEQIARCALVLQEINRKMATVTWQPPSS